MSEQSRNDPCACGSGKKYKKCCYLTKIAESTQVCATGFAAADRDWKFHRTHCVTCASAKGYELLCEDGRRLYSARLNAPDAAVRLRVPKPGTE